MQGYRPCAGIVVFNAQKKVLSCARLDKKGFAWQFPQGGINEGETPSDAALRELLEETSVKSVKIVKTLSKSLAYDFPLKVRQGLMQKGVSHIGQEMRWTLAYFEGSDAEINLQTAEPEFKAWKWADFDEVVREIVPFKRGVYEAVREAFAPLIQNF